MQALEPNLVNQWSDITGLKRKKNIDQRRHRKTHQDYKPQKKVLLDLNPL